MPTPPVIPVIDFGPFRAADATPADKARVAAELHAACRDVGFFYLHNHGVAATLRQRMLAGARTFFETASPAEKQAIALRKTSEGGDNARGWLRVENKQKGTHEAVDFYRPVTSDDRDDKKTTGMGDNQWPSRPVDFRQTAEAYVDQLLPLGAAVVEALAMGLGVDAKLFLERIDQAFWNLRILGYEGTKSKQADLAGIGEHTDFGILTFLLTDSTKHSLQVLGKGGQWEWADPIEDCYLCNIGDMLSTWTHGLYKSTLHRVVHTAESMRISIPFFFDPNWDAFISPVLPAPEGDAAAAEVQGVRYSDKFRKQSKCLFGGSH